MVNEYWFNTFLRRSRESTANNNAVVGILASEIAPLMLKLVNLWYCLRDSEISRLKEEISNSIGVKELVSDDEKYLMELALNEMLDEFKFITMYVARLGKKCVNPVYHQYERFAKDPVQYGLQWLGWQYKLKKMESKVKKMERFVAAVFQLSHELEVLAEVEQVCRRIQLNCGSNRHKLQEAKLKVLRQRQQVETLKESSPWNKSYDCIVRLLTRTLFTILERIIRVFANNHGSKHRETSGGELLSTCRLVRNSSLSASFGFCNDRQCESTKRSSPIRKCLSSRSLQVDKSGAKNKRKHDVLRSPRQLEQRLYLETLKSRHVGNFKGCMPTTGGSIRLKHFDIMDLEKVKIDDTVSVSSRKRIYSKLSVKGQLVKAPPSTLGDAALAFHYANVVVLIEKMITSPDFVDLQTRNDLYNMLPATIRTALKTRLKSYTICMATCVYDGRLEEEWNLALSQILGWLAPLAHNMIDWHSQRNFEKQNTASAINVLLMQTLHFANQAKTEATIVELLVGLNYLFRTTGKPSVKEFPCICETRNCANLTFRTRRKPQLILSSLMSAQF